MHARSNFINRRMEQFNNSDVNDRNPAMLALNAYENIIDQIRSSGLNFHLQLSPFSALISLKRSFVKERSGVLRVPRTESKTSPVPEPVNPKQESVEDSTTIKKETKDEDQTECLKHELKELLIENTRRK